MRPIERRLKILEARTPQGDADIEALTDEELDARILDELTELCVLGGTLEQVAHDLCEIAGDEHTKAILDEFAWDAETQTVRRVDKGPASLGGRGNVTRGAAL